MTETGFCIRDYPLVIEPTVQVLEGRAGRYHGAPPDMDSSGTWTTLYRVPLAPAVRQLALPSNIGHLFGDKPAFDDCQVILGYDSGGGLSHLCLRHARGWDCQELAEELTGKAVAHPSLRLVFRNAVARRRFLERVLRGKEAVYGLVEPPRIVEVWTLPQGAKES